MSALVIGSAPQIVPADRARYGREFAVALTLAISLYLASVAPGPLWQDSGMAQARVLRRDLVGNLGLALAHPLYYVIALAFQVLPPAESALKTNLVSAVFGALTVAGAYLFLRIQTGGVAAAAVGAISLAVAHTFWQHCALAEVYTVSTALLVAELLCLQQYARSGAPRWLLLLFFCNGLGISNHMLATLSLACYLVLAAGLAIQRRVSLRTAAGCGLAWMVGASLYLALIIGEWRGGTPIADVLKSALFGRNYARNVLNISPSTRLLLNTVLYLGLNFPTPAIILAVPGAAAAWRAAPTLFGRTLIALLTVHLLWAARYNVPDQYTFFIPAITLLAMLIGLGAGPFLARRGRGSCAVLIAAALLPAAVYVPLPQVARACGVKLGVERDVPYRDSYTYFLRPWKTGYSGAQRFAQELHDSLPDGAVVIADSTTARPVHYLALTGRWRRDVRIYPRGEHDPATDRPSEREFRDALAAARLFVISPTVRLPGSPEATYDFEPAGVVYRVVLRQ